MISVASTPVIIGSIAQTRNGVIYETLPVAGVASEACSDAAVGARSQPIRRTSIADAPTSNWRISSRPLPSRRRSWKAS